MSEGKCLDKCVSAGMQLQRDSDSYRADRSTPVIFAQNVRGLVKVDDMKVPHSELAMHLGAAGCNIMAWLMTCNTVTVVYEKDGCCGVAHGLQNELMEQPLIDTTRQMWMAGKCEKGDKEG